MRKRTERGQAAVEFVFALMIVIALASLLFQALSFELDVANQSAVARYTLFQQIRQSNQYSTSGSDVSTQITGKNLSDLTSYHVLLQPSIPGGGVFLPDNAAAAAGGLIFGLHYGPRKYEMYRGTQTYFSIPGFSEALGLLLLADHYEDTAGKATDVIGEFDSVLNSLNF